MKDGPDQRRHDAKPNHIANHPADRLPIITSHVAEDAIQGPSRADRRSDDCGGGDRSGTERSIHDSAPSSRWEHTDLSAIGTCGQTADDRPIVLHSQSRREEKAPGQAHDLQKTTTALNDAAGRLSSLFLTQLALNAAFGVVIGIGLWVIGVPNPVLRGILAAVLRLVPSRTESAA
jgi:hypothetical protein